LAARRDEISRKFFVDITQTSSPLHHLLPAQRDESLTSRLRNQEKFTRVYSTRTKRYCSFIHYALNNYQVKSSNSQTFSPIYHNIIPTLTNPKRSIFAAYHYFLYFICTSVCCILRYTFYLYLTRLFAFIRLFPYSSIQLISCKCVH